MNGSFLASAALTVSSLAGYVLGTVAPYPGREASIAGVLVGVTLATVTHGRSGGGATGPVIDAEATDPDDGARGGGGSR
ncbi:hypothetical protein [Halobaculum rubrum]|uniref:hypothetical protein n=1 Tax=Halobaculum rubrum TaxID=2872158 RepID=UPI001CA42D78|nr:hypothetical protein [Halobaculum rubrum]QZY00778.1 hypothetical protein K6T25_06830 [Halobaculum rubrum]